MLVIAFRQPLADVLWPQTRIQSLLDQADQALRAGHLDATDGSGARQLYEAAQALDNDRTEAADGLGRVAQAALRAADVALGQGRFDEARTRLALARDLQVPRPQADALALRLRTREAEHAGVDGLLAAAARAQADERLWGGDDTALPLYQRVLALQPTRIEALEGRKTRCPTCCRRPDRSSLAASWARPPRGSPRRARSMPAMWIFRRRKRRWPRPSTRDAVQVRAIWPVAGWHRRVRPTTRW